MRAEGDTVVIYEPHNRDTHESENWARGVIKETIAAHPSGSHALHVVRINAFKWAEADPWGPYDGVPEVLARETRGIDELTQVDTWPRRGR